MSKLLKAIADILIVLLIAVTVATFIPPLFGITTVVASPEMTSNMAVGTLAYGKRTSLEELQTGDTIIYSGDDYVILCDVKAVDAETGIVTVEAEGSTQDIQLHRTASKKLLALPVIGYFYIALHSFEGRIILLLSVALVVILFIIAEELGKREKERLDEQEKDDDEYFRGLENSRQRRSAVRETNAENQYDTEDLNRTPVQDIFAAADAGIAGADTAAHPGSDGFEPWAESGEVSDVLKNEETGTDGFGFSREAENAESAYEGDTIPLPDLQDTKSTGESGFEGTEEDLGFEGRAEAGTADVFGAGTDDRQVNLEADDKHVEVISVDESSSGQGEMKGVRPVWKSGSAEKLSNEPDTMDDAELSGKSGFEEAAEEASNELGGIETDSCARNGEPVNESANRLGENEEISGVRNGGSIKESANGSEKNEAVSDAWNDKPVNKLAEESEKNEAGSDAWNGEPVKKSADRSGEDKASDPGIGNEQISRMESALESVLQQTERMDHADHSRTPVSENPDSPSINTSGAEVPEEIELAMPVVTLEELLQEAYAAGDDPMIKKDAVTGVTTVDFSDSFRE